MGFWSRLSGKPKAKEETPAQEADIFARIFPGQRTSSGADAEELSRFVADLRRPLSAEEIADLRALWARQPAVAAPDPNTWFFPQRPLPETYLQFLRWSNGGGFVNGEREFGFFTTQNLREYMLAYEFPGFMPDALPFAMNGGGWFYVFDMRRDHSGGEYPILFAESGRLSYPKSYLLGDSFISVLSDGANPEAAALPDGIPIPYPETGRIWLMSAPPDGLKGMFRLKKRLAATWGALEMKEMLCSTPLLIIERGYPYAVSRRLQQDEDLLQCLGYSAEGSSEISRY